MVRTDRVSEPLTKGVAPDDVKVSMKIPDLKPLDEHWIVEMYTYLKQQKESILNGFDKAGIIEAVKSANEVLRRLKTLSLRNEQIKCKCRFA